MKIKYLVFYILIVVLFFTARIPQLGVDIINADSARWHARSINFLNSVKKGDYKNTYQHNQPGVILMWVESARLLIFKTELNTEKLNDSHFYIANNISSKTFLVIILGLLFTVSLYLLSNIFNNGVALIYGLIYSTEPFVIGIDRFFHVTSLETQLLFISMLLFIIYHKNSKKNHLIFSLIFYTLALLTKTSTLIILPVYISLLLYRFINFKNKDIFYLIIIPVVYFVLFPAMWVDPLFVLSKLNSGVTNAISTDIRSVTYNYILSFIYYPLVLVFRASPVLLISLFFTPLLFLKSQKNRIESIIPLLFITVYYFAFSIAVKKIDRYLLTIFPQLILLAGIFIYSLKIKFRICVLILFIISFLFFSYQYFPVYSAYYSPILFGSRGANRLGIYTNSGQYFFQATDYLNNNYSNLFVFNQYNKESFHYSFRDKKYAQDRKDKNTNFVVYSSNKIKTIDDLPKNCRTVEKTFGSRWEDVVVVYKCSKT